MKTSSTTETGLDFVIQGLCRNETSEQLEAFIAIKRYMQFPGQLTPAQHNDIKYYIEFTMRRLLKEEPGSGVQTMLI